MQRVKGRRVDFAGAEKVPQICARTGPAGVARAPRVWRSIVLGVPGVLNIDRPAAGEQLAVPRVPCRKYAVKQIDTAGDRLDEVPGRSSPHQVARAILREAGSCSSHDVVHDVYRLA